MKIAIDYRLVGSSNRGMARYCREIVNELMNLDTENHYVLLTNVIPENLQLPDNFEFVKLKIQNFILSEQISIPQVLKQINADVLWSPYNTFPIFLPRKIKLVVTIHDLIFLSKPKQKEALYKRIGRIYRKYVVKNFSKRIDYCFTVSNYSRTEIINILKLQCNCKITPNCLSANFINKTKKYITDKKDNFFFTVSGDNPSKNLKFLINVFKSKLPNEKLVIAGLSKQSNFRKYNTDNIIFCPANISDDELIEKYCRCKAFIFPSLQEGFGIPIIEALCCKAKVISSNKTCLPEIVGTRGILFNPTDENDFLKSLQHLDTYPFTYNIGEYISWRISAQTIYDEFMQLQK